MRAVKGAAVEHERGLGRGGLLEVDLGRVLLLVVLDAIDLPAESVERASLDPCTHSEVVKRLGGPPRGHPKMNIADGENNELK